MPSSTSDSIDATAKINSAISIVQDLIAGMENSANINVSDILPVECDGAGGIAYSSKYTSFMNDLTTIQEALTSVGILQNKLITEQLNQNAQTRIQNQTSKDLVQNEVDQVNARIKQLQQDKVSSVRMLEINNYFTERTKAYNQLITIVCGLIIFIIILTTLIKKQIIPSNISNLVLFVVILISVIIILSKLFDIFRRDNMDFNDFRFIDNVKANDPTVIEYNARQLGLVDVDATLDFNTCIGSSCCSEPGLVYDDAIDKCVAES